jgi:hypothetical protein
MDLATDLTKPSSPLGEPQSLAPLPVLYLCNKDRFEIYLSQTIFEIEATEFHGYEFTKLFALEGLNLIVMKETTKSVVDLT